jgi:hypothetical protein
MSGRDKASLAPTVTVIPQPTAPELAAILAVLARRSAAPSAPAAVATPWRDAARLEAIHHAWPGSTAHGWAGAARRAMQHAGQG